MEQEIREYEGLLDLLEDLDREGIFGFQRQEVYKRFLNLQARMRGQVYSGGFELTPLCNFDCKMCYVHLLNGQLSQPILTTEQWLNIMRQAVDSGLMHADLTGGECLTHPGFKELYLYLRSCGVEVAVLTNGKLIDDNMADFFAKYPPSVVQITVYGSNEDAYEAVTGHRAFADVCAAIDRLKKRGISVFLPITPNRYMQDDTHSLLDFLRTQKVRYGIGTGSLPARDDTGRMLESYSPSHDLYIKLHQDEQAYQKTLHVEPLPHVGKAVDRIPKNFKPNCKVPCSSGQCAFHVNWKGEMQPCIPYYTVTRSLLEHSFSDAWDWIKTQMLTYKPPHECLTCPHASVCASCPAERTLGILNGPINRDVCSRYESYVKAGILHSSDELECR